MLDSRFGFSSEEIDSLIFSSGGFIAAIKYQKSSLGICIKCQVKSCQDDLARLLKMIPQRLTIQ